MLTGFENGYRLIRVSDYIEKGVSPVNQEGSGAIFERLIINGSIKWVRAIGSDIEF